MKCLVKISRIPVMIIFIILVVSCASKRTITQSRVQKDAFGNASKFSVGKDEDGNPVMQSKERSSFEGKSSNISSNSDFKGADYTKKAYRSKRWNGSKDFNTSNFSGASKKASYENEPWFVKKQSQESQSSAREDKQGFITKLFKKPVAKEGTLNTIDNKSNAYTDYRKSVFKQPEVRSKASYVSDLTLQDTKRLLSR